jgi:ectoine hydroxylase-related dioxygenase (phytanoyl-CoA dioxygenase family)
VSGSAHVDYQSDAAGWTMLGFLFFMLDDFRPDNGATTFVSGSHRSPELDGIVDLQADHEEQVLACGPAGSMIVYNGSVWYGHTANRSDRPRRSIQGAYIRRDAQSGTDMRARMRPETLARLDAMARCVLAI